MEQVQGAAGPAHAEPRLRAGGPLGRPLLGALGQSARGGSGAALTMYAGFTAAWLLAARLRGLSFQRAALLRATASGLARHFPVT
jgi:hypothetical protein